MSTNHSDANSNVESSCSRTTNEARHVDGKLIKQQKRQRYMEKQQYARAMSRSPKLPDWSSWTTANKAFTTILSEEMVDPSRNDKDSPVYPYFDLQERPSPLVASANGTNDQLFIAEGTETVRILLQQLRSKRNPYLSSIEVKSIFVKPSVMFEPPVSLSEEIDRLKDELRHVPLKVIVAESASVQSLVAGFDMSRGALACGVVPQDRDWNWLVDYFGKLGSLPRADAANAPRPLRLVALDGVSDTANLGSIVRTSTALGVDAILLSPDCCDVWYRRAVRVSMGHVFQIPCVRVENLAGSIQQLAQSPWNVSSYAAVVQKETDLVLERVKYGGIASSWLAVFGSEGNGISPIVVEACDFTIRIDMAEGVDSLSLPIAAGIVLHGLKERSIQRMQE